MTRPMFAASAETGRQASCSQPKLCLRLTRYVITMLMAVGILYSSLLNVNRLDNFVRQSSSATTNVGAPKEEAAHREALLVEVRPTEVLYSSLLNNTRLDTFVGAPEESPHREALLVVEPRVEVRCEEPSESSVKLNVLYGLSGAIPEFIDEFDVSLKTVLLNAPIDADLDVHLVVDAAAHQAILKKFNDSGIEDSIWRNQISIIFYIVTDVMRDRYVQKVKDSLPRSNMTTLARVGSGGLFRLFAYEILPKDIPPVLYMDNDVVIMANLNEILMLIDPTKMYQVGIRDDVCSGLMIINLSRFHLFWGLLKTVPSRKIPRNRNDIGDQRMLALVKQSYRQLIGDLPRDWHVHMAHGFRYKAHLLREKRPQFGMLHFNAYRDTNAERWWDKGVWAYCGESADCRRNKANQEAFRQSWNLAEYYIHLPWSMAKYIGSTSVAGERGRPLTVRSQCAGESC